jgi:hypothetical protein
MVSPLVVTAMAVTQIDESSRSLPQFDLPGKLLFGPSYAF